MRRVSEDYRRLREELLPIFKLAKDRSQPLPYQPPVQSATTSSPELYHDTSSIISPGNLRNESSALGRSLSRRVYNGGTTPKSSNSPTHIPPSIHDGRPYNDGANIDPSAAAMARSPGPRPSLIADNHGMASGASSALPARSGDAPQPPPIRIPLPEVGSAHAASAPGARGLRPAAGQRGRAASVSGRARRGGQ